MENGWIKIHRKISQWDWYHDGNTFRVFFHLLINVNTEEKSWRGINISPGEVITGRKSLAADLNLSEQNIRTALKHLCLTNEITIKPTNEYSLIKVNNWREYQQNNQQINQPLTNDQPTPNQPLTTTKEYKNKKNNKNILESTPKKMASEFFENENNQRELAKVISQEKEMELSIVENEIRNFVGYWKELSASGKKERWESEKFFDVRRRLGTWFGRANQFKKPEKESVTFNL